MGLYLNPNADALKQSLRNAIYVDKSMIMDELNKLAETDYGFICMSRPRCFGKSMVGNMISAYYSKGCDTREFFSKMKVGQVEGFDKYLNKLNVIKLDLNGVYQNLKKKKEQNSLIRQIDESVTEEFKEEFVNVPFSDKDNSIDKCILKVYKETNEKFVIIIDEYDVLVREKVSADLFDCYLSFLNGLFKDATIRPAIALAYITGIIPIVRDKIQSKLNEFKEFTMLRPRQFAEHIGFTHEEVKTLCAQYNISLEECERWYDGYRISPNVSIYNPLSVVTAITDGEFANNWTTTGSFEALSDYIHLNFEGIKDDIIEMLAGHAVEVDTTTFLNTMNSFKCKDDVFTYLIHLGYLSYDRASNTCQIPNEEVRQEWVKAVRFNDGYKKLMEIINASKKLLDATINGDAESVAKALNDAHEQVTNPKTYNDEHCFQSALCLAYFYANTRYTLVKELPTGKGYADLVLIPYLPNTPAMVIELKRNGSTASAIKQIKEKSYCQALTQYHGDLLFVGINYDEKTKVHTCEIEKMES